MRIRMTETRDGSVDGVRVQTFQVGTEHDLTKTEGARSLARTFVSQRWAEEVLTGGGALPDDEAAPAPAPSHFEASEDEAPEAAPVAAGGHTVQHAGGPWFVVHDASGKAVTDRLKKRDAEAEAARLNGDA